MHLDKGEVMGLKVFDVAADQGIDLMGAKGCFSSFLLFSPMLHMKNKN